MSARACELDGPQRCLPSAQLVESPVTREAPGTVDEHANPDTRSLGVVNGVDTAVPCRDRRATLDGVGIAGTRADGNVDSPGAESSSQGQPIVRYPPGCVPTGWTTSRYGAYWDDSPGIVVGHDGRNHVVVGAAEEPAYLPTAKRAAAASELEPVEQRPLRTGRRVGEELNREACDPDRPDLRRSAPAVSVVPLDSSVPRP